MSTNTRTAHLLEDIASGGAWYDKFLKRGGRVNSEAIPPKGSPEDLKVLEELQKAQNSDSGQDEYLAALRSEASVLNRLSPCEDNSAQCRCASRDYIDRAPSLIPEEREGRKPPTPRRAPDEGTSEDGEICRADCWDLGWRMGNDRGGARDTVRGECARDMCERRVRMHVMRLCEPSL